MSITSQNIAPVIVPVRTDAPRKRVRPYKPRLATTVKVTMEATLRQALRCRTIMREMLDWLTEERGQMLDEMGNFEQLNMTGVGDRATQLARSLHHKRCARLGNLDHQIADLSLTLSEVEDEIRGILDKAKVTVEPPTSKEKSHAQ